MVLPLRFLAVAMLAVSAVGEVAHGHEFYAGQRSPDRRHACCNEVDCGPREVRLNSFTGELEIFMNQRWWPMMDPRWYLGPSPDGSAFGCQMPHDPVPRCTWGGAGT